MALLIMTPNISQAQKTEVKKPGVKEIGLEFLGATVGEFAIGVPTCLLIAYSVQWGSNAHGGPAVVSCLSGYFVGGCVGAPFATIKTGKLLHQDGSKLGAYCGGILGTYIGASILINAHDELASLRKYWLPMPKLGGEIVTIPLALLLPPAGSVIGYNLFRSKEASHSFLLKNLPAFALTFQPPDDKNKTSSEFGIKMTMGF